MSKGLALEFRDAGVRVNAIMPGGMNTPLIAQWLEKYLGHSPTPAQSTSPLLAEPEWIAQGILALASDELRWINGAELPMDGGAFLS